MEDFGKFVLETGLPGWAIMALTIFAIGVTIERVKTLYFDSALKTDEFMSNLHSLVIADKIEEGIALCEANKKAPLAKVMKVALERADRDEASINQGMDVALSEVGPKLGSKLGYLQMIANVVTLLGLLGTIRGLIMSFKAISFADPAQKQTLLTQGISESMNTTALGIGVAIPVMIIYAFLHSRQIKVMEDISGNTTKIIDWLRNRDYQAFAVDTVYPKSKEPVAPKAKTPPPANRAS